MHANTYLRNLKVIYFNSYWVGMVKYGYVLLGHRILKSAILQLKNKSMNWAHFLHAECDGSFWLEHELCSLSLGFKYWGSTVVVLHCSYYLLKCLLNFGVPQSLSHVQYCSSLLFLHFCINCMLSLVTIGFRRLILFYFSVSCCY